VTLSALLLGVPETDDLAVVRRGDEWVVGLSPVESVSLSGPAALAALDELTPGWWAGWLSYDLGRSVERVVPRQPDDLGLADLTLVRFAERERVPVTVETGDGPATGLAEAPWVSSLSMPEYRAGVAALIELIEAGECYQVNLTRRLSAPVAADPVGLFLALVRHNPAPWASLLRVGGTSVVSASPECFLRRRGRWVETRPIKGTAATPEVLAASAKDRAENVMITDLSRNDLGRVCVPGTITVPALCALEEHPGLWHMVSTVTGYLRPDVTTGGLIRATFPPASVTGCPKPRVLQVIEDTEPVRRGVYCGAAGWIDTEHEEMELNVAIRTFVVTGGHTHLGIGAGITAGSDPQGEWEETELKAARLLAAADGAALARPGVSR
jgi:para-aminobenzoate synthetase component 1